MTQNLSAFKEIVKTTKIIPVVIIDNWQQAVPLAASLEAAGIRAIEVTLRTKQAFEAIHAIAQEMPNMHLGAGTVYDSKNFEEAVKAGAKFIVSPGFHKDLAKCAEASNVPLLPGAITPSEIITAFSCGYSYLKFFPAMQAGGIAYIKSLASPFAKVKFCPTGGLTAETASSWLALPNVFCIGGSWIAPQKLILEGNFDQITQIAREARALYC